MNKSPGHRIVRTLAFVSCTTLLLPLIALAADEPAASPVIDHAKRIALNFAALTAHHWPAATKFVGFALLNIFLWAALCFFVGLLISVPLFMLLHRRGFLHAPWRWYRYARWAWPVLIIVPISLSMLAAGGALGLERHLRHAVLRDHALDRTVGHMVIAIYMDAADYQLTGDETAERLQKILDDSQAVATLATADLHERFYELAEQEQTGWRKYAFRWFGRRIISEKIDELLKIDPRAALILFLSPDIEQYFTDHPDAKLGVVLFNRQLESLRTLACKAIDMLLLPWLFAALAIGFGIPVLLLIALRIAVRVWHPRPDAQPPGSASIPPGNSTASAT